ncbi:MAG: BamA/TamA family outer membrane protein [Ignavibacterium sp.]|nr:BamA/TamA family outer membrane protein [Ignavibacterium sp.]
MIVRPLIKIIITLFLTSTIILAQKQFIKSLEVQGNKVFSQSDYLDWSGLKLNQSSFNGMLDSVSNRILRFLSLNGYFFAKIDSIYIIEIDSSNIKIIISINEDFPTIISSIEFLNADSTDKIFYEERFNSIIGSLLDKNSFENVIESLIKYYEDNGHPFAKVIVRSIQFSSDSIHSERKADIKLSIEKGALCRIDLIEIRGNEITKDYVITRELRLKKGDLYSQKKIDDLPNKLNRLRFFEPVKNPSFYINQKNEGVLVIEVLEKQTNNFDGIIGYIPPAKNESKGYVTGLANISLRNLFGTGRSVALRWNKFGRNSQELELKYLEPWLLNLPFNISFNFYQRIQDTTYVQRKIESNFEYLASENISASLIVGSEVVIPTERVIPVFTVFNSSLITTGFSIKYDTRDDPYSPTKGVSFTNTYLYSKKNISGPERFLTLQVVRNVNLQRIISDLEFFTSIFNRQVLAVSFHLRELKGKSFESTDLFKLGGTNSLRGYREEQFIGNRIFWSNLEYRFLLTARTFVFSFFDIGYYLRLADSSKNIMKMESLLYGYGVGINLETAIGVLAVSFALGKEDSFSEGKIHFGIVNEF